MGLHALRLARAFYACLISAEFPVSFVFFYGRVGGRGAPGDTLASRCMSGSRISQCPVYRESLQVSLSGLMGWHLQEGKDFLHSFLALVAHLYSGAHRSGVERAEYKST